MLEVHMQNTLKKKKIITLWLSVLILFTGCSAEIDYEDNGSDEPRVLSIKPECEAKRAQLNHLCENSNLDELSIRTLLECEVIKVSEEDFLDHCDDKKKIEIDYFVSKLYKEKIDEKSKYNEALSEKCGDTKINNMTLNEVDFCCLYFDFNYCKKE
jgi:hypothetical protein